MAIKNPTKGQLKLLADYLYHKDGSLYCKKSYGRGGKKKCVGQRVGWPNLHGYEQIYFFGRVYMVHRVIYYLHHGVYPTLEIDHIDGNGLNNCPTNLREVTRKQNTRSYSKPRVGGRYTSKYRGVSYHKPTRTWRARMIYNYKEENLGYFKSEDEAALAWNIKAQELGFNPEAFNQVFNY